MYASKKPCSRQFWQEMNLFIVPSWTDITSSELHVKMEVMAFSHELCYLKSVSGKVITWLILPLSLSLFPSSAFELEFPILNALRLRGFQEKSLHTVVESYYFSVNKFKIF